MIVIGTLGPQKVQKPHELLLGQPIHAESWKLIALDLFIYAKTPVDAMRSRA